MVRKQLINSSLKRVIDANNALMAKQQQKLFSYDAYKAATEVTDEMKSAIDAAITELNANKLPGQPNYVYPANGFEYVAKKDIAWGVDKNSQNQDIPSTVAKYPSDLQAIANNYVQWITMVDAATIDPNEVAQAEAAMKRAQEEQKAANEAYTAAKEGWETLQEIIAGEKAYSVPTTDFTKSTTAYSTAFAALDKAIKDWNTAVDNAYQTAYDEAISEWKFELRIDANNALMAKQQQKLVLLMLPKLGSSRLLTHAVAPVRMLPISQPMFGR